MGFPQWASLNFEDEISWELRLRILWIELGDALAQGARRISDPFMLQCLLVAFMTGVALAIPILGICWIRLNTYAKNAKGITPTDGSVKEATRPGAVDDTVLPSVSQVQRLICQARSTTQSKSHAPNTHTQSYQSHSCSHSPNGSTPGSGSRVRG